MAEDVYLVTFRGLYETTTDAPHHFDLSTTLRVSDTATDEELFAEISRVVEDTWPREAGLCGQTSRRNSTHLSEIEIKKVTATQAVDFPPDRLAQLNNPFRPAS